jgi:hypothetical protein
VSIRAVAKIAPHFLRAVVIKHVAVNAGDIQRFWVIDGRQRLTTLQILLDAAALVVADLGRDDGAEQLLIAVAAPSGASRYGCSSPRRPYAWPSRAAPPPWRATAARPFRVWPVPAPHSGAGIWTTLPPWG